MKDISGYEGLYAITEDGQVWSHPKTWISGKGGSCSHAGRFLANARHTGGYIQTSLNGRMKYVHRLVAQAYVPNPLGLPEVNHKDTDKTNNHYTNLEWMTRKQNAKHAQLLGLYKHEPARGEAHPDAKMTDADVYLIRALHAQKWKRRELLHIFPLSKSAMHAICTGESWTHLLPT